VPGSLKKPKLLAAAKAFSSASSAVLVWPGHTALPSIQGLSTSSNTQVVYLGEPPKETAGMFCPLACSSFDVQVPDI
jgi:hypothetical protein